MTLEEKQQIIDNYAKAIANYLHFGLCESSVSGSYGDDLMRHFDIMVSNFKEMVKIEEELGINLITLFEVLKNGFYYKDDFGDIEYFDMKIMKPKIDDVLKEFADYGKTWALTKEELL